MIKAQGHIANIIDFNDSVVLVPFTWHELGLLIRSLEMKMSHLRSSGDYPEETDHMRTLSNLKAAQTVIKKISG